MNVKEKLKELAKCLYAETPDKQPSCCAFVDLNNLLIIEDISNCTTKEIKEVYEDYMKYWNATQKWVILSDGDKCPSCGARPLIKLSLTAAKCESCNQPGTVKRGEPGTYYVSWKTTD